MAILKTLLAILFAVSTFFSAGASAQVTEKVFSSFEECRTAQVPYYPTISRPKAGGQRMTISDVHPVFKDGTCVLSSELVEVRDGKKILVTGWAFLPGHFEIVKVGESYYMYACSNAITRIGPPDGWQPPAPTFVATTPTQPRNVEVDFVADEPRYTAPASNAGGSQYAGYSQGMSTGKAIVLTGAILGGAYVLDRAFDRASKPRTVNNITNTGQCAGANVVTTGDGNIVCSNVTTPPLVVPVCNAPNRLIGGVCTTPPICQGAAVLDRNSLTCQCPAGRVEVNGVCQVPVQYCPDGSVRPTNGQCPTVCTIIGQTPVNGVCQCLNGLEVRNGSCQVPVEYCPNGSVRPANGQCPIVCTNGRIDRGGYCGCLGGQVEVNGFCQTPPQCRYDQVLMGTTCQCAPGLVELNGFCQVAPAYTPPAPPYTPPAPPYGPPAEPVGGGYTAPPTYTPPVGGTAPGYTAPGGPIYNGPGEPMCGNPPC